MTNSVMLSAFCYWNDSYYMLMLYAWACTVFYALSVFEVEFNWFCISFVQFYWFLIYSFKINGNVILCETYFMPSMAVECGCMTNTLIGGM